MNKQVTLHVDKIEFIISALTAYAQILRVMRQHEKAEKAETVRNTINVQT